MDQLRKISKKTPKKQNQTKNKKNTHTPKLKRPYSYKNLTKKQREALIELSTREDLITTRADKNQITVIWGIDEYRKEANNQWNNKEFYYELRTEPFEDHQDTIINSLNDMVGKNLIDKETLEILKSHNVKPSRFYLQPNIHKMINPGKQVISLINHFLSLWL